MIRGPFTTAADTKGIHNWNTKQPVQFPVAPGEQENMFNQIDKYVEMAEKLRPSLDAYAAYLKDKLGVSIEFGPACVKKAESAKRKLDDASIQWDPANINDFLRITGEITSTGRNSEEDTLALMEYLETSDETLGFKNQIAFPDPETGMRSFKVHTLITDPHDPSIQMTAEILIGHAGMKKAYETTLGLRQFERDLRRLVRASPEVFGRNSKTVQKGVVSINGIRELRKAIHHEAAEKVGWNKLLDPKSGIKQDQTVADLKAKTLAGALGKDRIAALIEPALT